MDYFSFLAYPYPVLVTTIPKIESYVLCVIQQLKLKLRFNKPTLKGNKRTELSLKSKQKIEDKAVGPSVYTHTIDAPLGCEK